jgi:hypothetical protein
VHGEFDINVPWKISVRLEWKSVASGSYPSGFLPLPFPDGGIRQHSYFLGSP